MKKTIFLFLICSSALMAEPNKVGVASKNSAQTANNWKNWAFAGGAVIVALIGILAVSFDRGNNPTSTDTH